MDVIVSRKEGPPLLLEKQRGGPLIPREMPNWVAGAVFCTADFDNDLRPDLAVVNDGKISICSNGGERKEIAFPGSAGCRQIVAVDYDNDGWLDLKVIGRARLAYRPAGFEEQKSGTRPDKFDGGSVSKSTSRFDKDRDPDVASPGNGACATSAMRWQRHPK
jgi:hypothetical protein